jgi:hypothetical protein
MALKLFVSRHCCTVRSNRCQSPLPSPSVLGSFQNIRQSSDQNARLMPVAREAHNRRFLTRAKLAARIEVDGGTCRKQTSTSNRILAGAAANCFSRRLASPYSGQDGFFGKGRPSERQLDDTLGLQPRNPTCSECTGSVLSGERKGGRMRLKPTAI